MLEELLTAVSILGRSHAKYCNHGDAPGCVAQRILRIAGVEFAGLLMAVSCSAIVDGVKSIFPTEDVSEIGACHCPGHDCVSYAAVRHADFWSRGRMQGSRARYAVLVVVST